MSSYGTGGDCFRPYYFNKGNEVDKAKVEVIEKLLPPSSLKAIFLGSHKSDVARAAESGPPKQNYS